MCLCSLWKVHELQLHRNLLRSGCRKRRCGKRSSITFFRFRDAFGHFSVTFSDASVTFFVAFLPNSFCRTPFAAGWLETYSCHQVTTTIAWIIPLQIIYVNLSWTMESSKTCSVCWLFFSRLWKMQSSNLSEGLIFLLACSVHFVRRRFGRLLWDSVEIAQNHRLTTCTGHASKKIRPSKWLEPYRASRNYCISNSRTFYLVSVSASLTV